MEAIFSFKSSELNEEMLQKIKDLAGRDSVVTIGISDEKELHLNETKEEFIHRIQSRIDEYHSFNNYPEENSLSTINKEASK